VDQEIAIAKAVPKPMPDFTADAEEDELTRLRIGENESARNATVVLIVLIVLIVLTRA